MKVEDVHANSGRDVASKYGWTRLGCGVGRCAYKWKPKCVIKFARSGRRPITGNPNRVVGYGSFNGVTGEESNTYEVASFSLAEDAVKKFLTPIIAHSPPNDSHGYKWIVTPMARTDRNDSLDRTKMDNMMRQIRQGLEDANAHCEDMHYGNIGLLLDKYPVLIDYGFSVRCKRAQKGDVAKQKAVRKLSEFGDTKHRGRHGLKRPRGAGIPMGVLTRRRRILWAEAGALRRKAKQYTDPDVRERLIADARFLEQQAWAFQTKAIERGDKMKTSEVDRVMALLNQTRKEAFMGAEQ